jgi:hypothetical protein
MVVRHGVAPTDMRVPQARIRWELESVRGSPSGSAAQPLRNLLQDRDQSGYSRAVGECVGGHRQPGDLGDWSRGLRRGR